MRAPSWPLLHLSEWALTASVLAGTTGEVAAWASVRSIGVDSASPCGGGTTGDDVSLVSISSVGSDRQWWRARQVRALFWPLFDRSSWAQPDTLMEGTTGVGAALASFRSFGVGSDNHCGGGHYSSGRCSGLRTFVRRGLSQPLGRLDRQVRSLLRPLFAWLAWTQAATVLAATTGRALLWPLFAWFAWAQPATVVVSTTGQGAGLASFP
jgi:hypothetical protein